MSIHVYDVFMAVSTETLEKNKEIINLKLNIQECSKVMKFIGVYYKWGHDSKSLYANINMEKDVNKLVEGYDKFIGNDFKVHKTPGAPGVTLSKIDLE